jgi:AcrR family transcriptional regulator
MSSEEVSKPRRSDATKAAILAAARERFAADGYDRATIRAIAADAAIDPAMVMRYFGSKEQLFAKAAHFDLRLPDLAGIPKERVGRALVAHFVERWEGDDTLMALLRTSVTNEAAAERMRGIFGAQLGPVVAAISGDRDGAATRGGLIASQILGFALCRYVLRLAPIVALEPDEIGRWLGPTLERYLLAPADG